MVATITHTHPTHTQANRFYVLTDRRTDHYPWSIFAKHTKLNQMEFLGNAGNGDTC